MSETEKTSCDDILDVLPVGVLIFDESGDVIQSNNVANAMITRLVPETLILTFSDFVGELGITPLPVNTAFARQEIRKNNQIVLVHLRRETLREKSRQLAVLTDMTAQHRLFDAHQQQTSAMLWKMRGRLAPVQNAVTILTDYGEGLDDASRENLLCHSGHELWQIDRHLEIYRDFTLLHANRLRASLAYEDVFLDEIVASAIEGLNMFLKVQDTVPQIASEVATGCLVQMDRGRAIRTVQSLILNAVAYSDPPAQVTLFSRDTNNGYLLAVDDNGWGIPLDEHCRVFSYGYRGSNVAASEYAGTGAELCLAAHLCLLSGATISFHSTPGQGTIFEIVFRKGNGA